MLSVARRFCGVSCSMISPLCMTITESELRMVATRCCNTKENSVFKRKLKMQACQPAFTDI